MPLTSPEPFFGDELGERFAQAFERPRGVGVGAGLERVLALEFEQGANFDEHLSDFVFVHAPIMQRTIRFRQSLRKRLPVRQQGWSRPPSP